MATREELEEAILHGSTADKAAAGAATAAAAGAWAANRKLNQLNQQAQLTNSQLAALNRTSNATLDATLQSVRELRHVNQQLNKTQETIEEIRDEARRAHFVRWKNHDAEGQYYARWESDAKFMVAMITRNTETMMAAYRKDAYNLALEYAREDPEILEISAPEHTQAYRPDNTDMTLIQQANSNANPLRSNLSRAAIICLIMFPVCLLLLFTHAVMGELYDFTGNVMWLFPIAAIILFTLARFVKSTPEETAGGEARRREAQRKAAYNSIEHYSIAERDKRVDERFREIVEQVRDDMPKPWEWTDFDIMGYALRIDSAISNAPKLLPDPQDLPALGDIYVNRDDSRFASMPNMRAALAKLPDITHDLKR